MPTILLPAVWLIVLLAGLSQLTETIYTPVLPTIAHALHTSAPMVEHTLTLYLGGFAFGTLFWGRLSDFIGRKPCILMGLSFFILGCISCYFSSTIESLMISRLIQGFGGSVGSVLAQAVCRDAFQGAALGKVYSSVGASLALFPALGPVLGGLITERFEWPTIFLILISCALALIGLVFYKLPETLIPKREAAKSLRHVALHLFQDKRLIGFGLIVAAGNGIGFSYFAEGSFYLIELLGLSPSQYGLSFIAIALSTFLGGLYSRKLHTSRSSECILSYGIRIILCTTLVFSSLIMSQVWLGFLPAPFLILLTIGAQMSIMFGVCMSTSNALALALAHHKNHLGTASSLFGFFYYSVMSVFLLGMSLFHNGTLLPMPLYFLALSLLIFGIKRWSLRS